MKGSIMLWGILILLMLAMMIFAGDRLYGMAQMVLETISNVAARLAAFIGSLA